MVTKLFVGNLPYGASDDSLREKFEAIGSVASASIVTDRQTGRSRGFGFVEMESDEDAKEAISKLNNIDFEGRNMTVNEARPSAPRQGGSYGGGQRDRRGGDYRRERYDRAY